LRDLDGRQHNICDVGFGCSQVLPVLIGALNLFEERGQLTASPIFVVQEPEIHLHPNAQATLGSFFASLAQQSGQIFIETHSDNLVLRIARHVASGHLFPQDVAIFLFQNGKRGKQVKRITLGNRANFMPPWPGGFFPQREVEALELARARARISTGTISTLRLPFHYPD
jgi:predicted ATPase